MTPQERAEQLMAKGPIWLVRRVMELESVLRGVRRVMELEALSSEDYTTEITTASSDSLQERDRDEKS